MDEPTIDHALLDALSKADAGPYPRRIPYAATIRQFLPDPVTALRWATCTAAGTIALGGAALVVKALGIDHQAPPAVAAELTEMRALPGVEPEAPAAVVLTPQAEREMAPVVRTEPAAQPVTLMAEQDVAKVSVVRTAYEPRHAAPDLGLNLLGMTLAVDLS